MGSFADHWEDEVLDHVFGKGAYTPPTIYVGLSTADPLDNASGLAEPVGNGYTRVTTAAVDWTVSSGGALDNAAALDFPTASGAWGTVTHFALFDAASAGNMLAHGILGTPQAIVNGNTPSFAIGALDVSLD